MVRRPKHVMTLSVDFPWWLSLLLTSLTAGAAPAAGAAALGAGGGSSVGATNLGFASVSLLGKTEHAGPARC